jgi:hypothetical protein
VDIIQKNVPLLYMTLGRKCARQIIHTKVIKGYNYNTWIMAVYNIHHVYYMKTIYQNEKYKLMSIIILVHRNIYRNSYQF